MTKRIGISRLAGFAAVCLLAPACAGPPHTDGDGESEPVASTNANVSPALDDKKTDCTPVPNTRVCLVAPPGHEPGQGFDGYQWSDTGASLIILEFPAPQAAIASGLAVPGPIGEGMTVLHSESLQACGGKGQLAQVSQTAAGTLYHKWFLACGDEKETLMLNAVYPASHEETLSASLRAALLSAVWDRSIVVDSFAKVDWSIVAPPELHLAHESGGMFMYMQDAALEQQDTRAPSFIVAPSMGTVAIEDLRTTAEARFHQLAQLQSIEITSSQAKTIGSVDAWEIVGQARDSKSDVPLSVYQVMLVRGDSYILVVGTVDAKLAPEWIERFRTAASSWKPKQP
jgi:hypothetical protein